MHSRLRSTRKAPAVSDPTAPALIKVAEKKPIKVKGSASRSRHFCICHIPAVECQEKYESSLKAFLKNYLFWEWYKYIKYQKAATFLSLDTSQAMPVWLLAAEMAFPKLLVTKPGGYIHSPRCLKDTSASVSHRAGLFPSLESPPSFCSERKADTLTEERQQLPEFLSALRTWAYSSWVWFCEFPLESP